jgi:hypothetical protein
MSALIVRRPPNRLAKLIQAPGGPTVEQALADADERLKAIGEAGRAELQRLLASIQALGKALGTSPTEGQIDAIYGLSDEVLSIATVAGSPDFGPAALSLCELLDGLKTRGIWSPSAVQVHLDGLQLLADPSVAHSPQQTQAVVEGLRRVVQRTLR